MTITPIALNDLTTATLQGGGTFDVIMRSVRAHLAEEFHAGRIKGAEYATVYLGSMSQAMQHALAFLLQARKVERENALLDKQIELANKAIEKAQVELEILQASQAKIPAEIAQLGAQTALLEQQTLNAVTENTVLVAQECKLRAEYDSLLAQIVRTNEEAALLVQKRTTERAQTQDIGVDEASVIGQQRKLYGAQAEGFLRDAEQKAAKLLVDSWSVRRTTDEGTVADSVNQLNDISVGKAVAKLLAGINA